MIHKNLKKTKFLLLGGGGFVGTNLNKYMNKKKIEKVINIDNGRLSTGLIEYIHLDLINFNSDNLKKYLKNVDVVVNLAAVTRVEESIIDPKLSFSSNLAIHLNLLETLRQIQQEGQKPPICLFYSTGGALAGETDEIITEKTLPKPISPYGASKLACESIGFSYFKTYNLDVRNLRFTNIYGPYCEKKESVIARFIKKIRNNEAITIRDNGEMVRDFVYVEDVAEATFKMVMNGFPGMTVQFGSGEKTSVRDLVNELRKIEPRVLVKSEKSMLGEVSKVQCDVTYAKNVLNWQPKIKLDEGIKKTWDYFEKNR